MYAPIRTSMSEYAEIRPSTPGYVPMRPGTLQYARVCRPSTPERNYHQYAPVSLGRKHDSAIHPVMEPFHTSAADVAIAAPRSSSGTGQGTRRDRSSCQVAETLQDPVLSVIFPLKCFNAARQPAHTRRTRRMPQCTGAWFCSRAFPSH